MSATGPIPPRRCRFSVAWCVVIALFHLVTSFILLVYYMLAQMTAFVDEGSSAHLWQTVLSFWSPLVLVNPNEGLALLLALSFSVIVGVAVGFLAPMLGQRVEAQAWHRARVQSRPFSRSSRICVTCGIVALELLWGGWYFVATFKVEDPRPTLPDFFRIRTWAVQFQQAPQFVVYAGLPRQASDSSLPQNEPSTTKTREVFGYLFYEPALTIAPEDRNALIRLSTSTSSFRSYRGPKLCGGFHPDYCLEWKNGTDSYYMLLCFSCHEVILHQAKRDFLGEVRNRAFEGFKKVFEKYQDQRPKTE